MKTLKVKWAVTVVFVSFLLYPAAIFATDDSSSQDPLSKKIDQVARTQKIILEKLEEIKTELNIVKVRASQR